MDASRRWAGVDVGGVDKGFDAVVIDGGSVVAGPSRLHDVPHLLGWLASQGPRIVAVDAPRRPAAAGERSRPGERELARTICALYYTPDAATAANSRFHAWMRHGWAAHRALERAGDWQVIECYPTATWTRLVGPRNGRTRAAWTSDGIDRLGVSGLPARMSQDARDAVAAAVTARLAGEGRTETFGDIHVPRVGAPLPAGPSCGP